jgi:short-subunit dehydrogenase
MKLRDTVALITGGSSGIGAETARVLAARGARPLVVGRDRPRLERVARETAGIPIEADLAAPDGPMMACTRALEVADRVDILINNAGVGWAGSLEAMSDADMERVVATNLLAPLHLTRLLTPEMKEHGRGHLVFVSSIAGAVGVADEAVYSSTKAGVNAFADALREELAGGGIDVTVVVPGVVDTAFFTNRGVPYSRGWPRPIPSARVATAIVKAIEQRRSEVFVPGWMRFPARLSGGAPALFRRLAALGSPRS